MTAFATARAGAGEWIGVLGERTAVVLPPLSAAVAARVWLSLDAGESFDGALDAVLAEGLSQVPSFVIAEVNGSGTLRLLVRGTPHVRAHLADGTTRVLDSGAGVWHDEVVDAVVGIEIDPGTSAWAAEPFTVGVRRLGSLAWGSAALDSPVLQAPAAHAVPPVVRHAVEVPDVAELVAEGSASLYAGDETAPLAAVRVPPDPVVAPAAAALPPATPDEAVTDVLAAVPASPAPTPEPVTTVQPVARVTFSHGLVMVLEGPCVVGRAPSASASAFAGARTVSVPSPLGEVSASHLEIFPGVGPQAGLVLVADLGSTNGTVVRREGRPPVELIAGAPWVLDPGSTVDLGDGATLRIALL